jgi:hypothetical protein
MGILKQKIKERVLKAAEDLFTGYGTSSLGRLAVRQLNSTIRMGD